MLLKFILATTLITYATTQENTKQQKDELQNTERQSPLVYFGTPNPQFLQQNDVQPQVDLNQYISEQQYSPELYRTAYVQPLQPQYQAEGPVPRLQPQIVFYGPGGQGQPILINPGNPPGNFLFPQGPGPNVIIRNSPQNPQGSVFPVAGYPKPAHIPPIEKDAEEIPTNPEMIPPLQSKDKPETKSSGNKPEKLETFNEPNQPDQNIGVNKGQIPPVSLSPGQRFFILNGDNLFGYPFEAQPHQVQQDIQAFRYANVQPFSQNPPKFLNTFGQEPSPIMQGQENTVPIPVPNLDQGNSFISSQGNQQPDSQSKQSELQPKQSESDSRQPNQAENDDAIKIRQPYHGTEFPINLSEFYLYPQEYPVHQQRQVAVPLNRNIQEIQGVQGITSKDEVIQPQVVGQFRFTPDPVSGQFSFKDDYENDAIVIDASFNGPNNFGVRGENLKDEESETTTPKQPPQKEYEPSMAQAGPQATAIAGPGGVAGSAPRGTAIVGKGGLAVSSPQATAVAGTKDEDKKKKPVKKNT